MFAIVLCHLVSRSQQTYQFTKGLTTTNNSHYGREALYTDSIAYLLYTAKLNTENWTPVEADSANRFISPRTRDRNAFNRSGSYLYLTYNSPDARPAILNIQGASGAYLNGEPHATDPYAMGWLDLPVQLKKGTNELLIRGAFVKASLSFSEKPVFIHTGDSTLPFVIAGNPSDSLWGAVVIVNTTAKPIIGLSIRSSFQGKEMVTTVPGIAPYMSRKVAFSFNGSVNVPKGKHDCSLTLLHNATTVDEETIKIEAVAAGEQYSSTFISDIDGSLQYYSVTPQLRRTDTAALFLSVHGAAVEAINQARAYKPKDWGTVVAPTNRRPRGFNWEDWGRLDALEVLEIAKKRFQPDPQHIYLTGHSMGGHGTWFLGATYPDKWAAIAPCSGYPTLKGYGSADGLIPDSASTPAEQMLLRSGNQSDVIKLSPNYKPLGVYILHGDSDEVVSVKYARQMRVELANFHTDMSYYEYPGGEHWFGDQSVDWKPLFDFFKWHKRPADSLVENIDFKTASPGISSKAYWASVIQQRYPLAFSRIILRRNRTSGSIGGTAENVRLLKLDLKEFGTNRLIKIMLDSTNPVSYTSQSATDSIYLIKENSGWAIAKPPAATEKNPRRYGSFKDAFNHRMIFVYGTTGNAEENEWSIVKARYDAETWYYRGNGAVDIIADKNFNAAKYKDRGVILYGNKNSNSAWKMLLSDCPIQVERNKIIAGTNTWQGNDLAALFVWPLKNSDIASVGVVSGTGIKGMKAAFANQYFAGASGFPDFMIYSLEMLRSGASQVKFTGFFDHQWKLDPDNFMQSK